MRGYLGNKMTGKPNYNFAWFDKNRDYLVAMGHDVVSPADMDRKNGWVTEIDGVVETTPGFNLQVALRSDFQIICDSECIFLGPDWEVSVGARKERFVAESIGLRIFHVDADTDTFYEETPPLLLGVNGYAQTGKDTAAAAAIELGYERAAFADLLRAVLYALNPIVMATGSTEDPEVVRIADLVDAVGWDVAKQNPEVRALLQRMGTDAGRKILGENIWVDALMRRLESGKQYVISDVRFVNEAQAIRSRGGEVWRIEREGFGPVNGHESETALDGYAFDLTLHNDGTQESFEEFVQQVLPGMEP